MMLKMIFKFFVLFFYFTGTKGFAQQASYITDGEKGIEAFRQGNLILAMELLNKSATQGYAPAQTTLAYILDQSEENQRAFELFQQAAKNNYPAAMFGLGNMYAKGEGTKKNSLKAGQWIKQSALQNHLPAIRAMAYALEFGTLGFEKNTQQSLQRYTQCSNAGDTVCTRRLVQTYGSGDLGQPVDKKKAAELQRQLNPPPEDKK